MRFPLCACPSCSFAAEIGGSGGTGQGHGWARRTAVGPAARELRGRPQPRRSQHHQLTDEPTGRETPVLFVFRRFALPGARRRLSWSRFCEVCSSCGWVARLSLVVGDNLGEGAALVATGFPFRGVHAVKLAVSGIEAAVALRATPT